MTRRWTGRWAGVGAGAGAGAVPRACGIEREPKVERERDSGRGREMKEENQERGKGTGEENGVEGLCFLGTWSERCSKHFSAACIFSSARSMISGQNSWHTSQFLLGMPQLWAVSSPFAGRRKVTWVCAIAMIV